MVFHKSEKPIKLYKIKHSWDCMYKIVMPFYGQSLRIYALNIDSSTPLSVSSLNLQVIHVLHIWEYYFIEWNQKQQMIYSPLSEMHCQKSLGWNVFSATYVHVDCYLHAIEPTLPPEVPGSSSTCPNNMMWDWKKRTRGQNPLSSGGLGPGVNHLISVLMCNIQTSVLPLLTQLIGDGEE